MIIYILTALLAGCALGYLIARYAMQGLLSAAKIEAASKIDKEELARNYIHRELYERLEKQYEQALEEIGDCEATILNNQESILRLTRLSEQKLSKEEVEKAFVSKETFDFVQRKLQRTESEAEEKNDLVLRLSEDMATLKKEKEGLAEKLSVFREEINALHQLSQQQFKNIAADILEEKKKLFVETNKTELGHILTPLKSDLEAFKKTVEETRKEDIKDISSLKVEINALQKLNVQLSDDARNLANALKSDTRIQGAWGEDRLKLILEGEGLQKYIDYRTQDIYEDEEQERNRKPDLILKLPNDKHLIIDSKVSLTAYVNYYNAKDEADKARYLKLHLKSVTDHIDLLANKNYHLLSGINSPDYVFMFMPIESAITLALNENEALFTRALNKKIVLTSPTTLVATLKVIKIIWQKENQVKNVQEIFRQCGLLYDKFVTFIEEMDKVGAGLSQANKSYKEAIDRLKDGARKGDTIIGRFENIRKLEARTAKKLPDKWLNEIQEEDITE
ncbi:MAG: DNA recombination protein RmuC [Chitinophagaceae bacterium]|nr:DNA recombination protein RmuC [Chitinophagaceae bacterium]